MKRDLSDAAKKHPQAYTRLLVLAGALLVSAAAMAADDDAADSPSVTPYRPSVSTPAALSAPGWLEGEAGINAARLPGNEHRTNLPYSLKLAFSDNWGVRLSGDALVYDRIDSGPSEFGGGDTGVTVKRRFALDEHHAFGLEVSWLLPTAARGLGNGRSAPGLNGIYSADFGQWHADTNLVATRLGAPYGQASGASSWQSLAALALSHQITETLSGTVEWSGTHQRGVSTNRQLLGALAYTVSPRLVLDAGVARSLGGNSQWSMFTGATFLIERVLPR